MNCSRRSLTLALVLAHGCVNPGHDDASLATTAQAQQTLNGISLEELGFNSLMTNPDAMELLLMRPLSDSVYLTGADPDAIYLRTQLRPEGARRALSYLVSCALPAGQDVRWQDPDGPESDVAYGQLGLCPRWRTGEPDAMCKERVSACLLARQNALGATVNISMRGAGYGFPTTTEQAALPWREGAFFGDIFDPGALASGLSVEVLGESLVFQYRGVTETAHCEPAPTVGMSGCAEEASARETFLGTSRYAGSVFGAMYACSSPAWTDDVAYLHKRVCAGPNDEACLAQTVGPCCDHCAIDDDSPVGDGDYNACVGNGQLFEQVATVYLADPCSLVPDACDTVTQDHVVSSQCP